MKLFTNELILRTVDENDIDEVVRMWGYPEEITIEEAHQALEYMKNTHNKNQPKAICHLCLAVYRKEEPKRIIGWCGLDGEAEPDKTVLFYMIDEKFRNQGYATQCAIELIRYAFEDMDYDVIYGGCARENHESYRVMQKAGMNQDSFYENGDYYFTIDRESFLNSKKCKEELRATIARIQRMEQYLDEVLNAMSVSTDAIKENATIRKMIQELIDYYDNGQWMQDYECDERGDLPPDLKRGVLSEDALYDLLCEIREPEE